MHPYGNTPCPYDFLRSDWRELRIFLQQVPKDGVVETTADEMHLQRIHPLLLVPACNSHTQTHIHERVMKIHPVQIDKGICAPDTHRRSVSGMSLQTPVRASNSLEQQQRETHN